MHVSRFLAFLSVGFFAAAAQAGVTLERPFSDGAVLQRGQPVPVWGRAAPGEKVAVEFAGQTKTTVADAGGRWSVTLDPLAASATPRPLIARGTNVVEAKDVVVGEVWLFSGQSNMAFLMSAMARPSERDAVSPALAQREIATANDALLREFRVDNRPAERPRDDVPTQTGWLRWSVKTAPQWAAMAYFFGKRLRAELEVPVGIVMCAWGGSGCSAWISPETLRGPELNALWPEDVIGWRFNLAPSRLYHGMLRPVAPFALAGFGWYQGETEAAPYHNPYVYRHLLAVMIQDWRRAWARADLPFYIVQLPNRDNEPRWVIARESQAAALGLPHTALLPTIDIGQSWDLHPRNKHAVANRLANLILGREYGRNTWPGCAMFDRVAREGAALRVHFRDAEAGLRTTDGLPPAEFSVAGSDGKFAAAEARIDGATIVVRSAAVAAPVAVRYAWTPAPKVNLVNSGGMPVPPFRSDDWPVDGQEMMPQPLPVKPKLAHESAGGALLAGNAEDWHASEQVAALRESAPLVLRGGKAGSILVRGFPVRPGGDPSPALYWTAEPAIEATRGLTLEVRAYVTRIGHPDRGLDLEAGVRRADGTFRRYLLTVFPARLHTFQNNLAPRNSQATETRVLRSDLDLQPAIYRVAVRADGVAQFYYNGALVGTTTGETLTQAVPARSYLRVGKTVAAGEWIVNLYSVAYDLTGAFAPEKGAAADRDANATDAEP